MLIILLFFIACILSIQNYTPGTFLSGWDTLHPEFDFGLNLQRAIFGVFREEQGLGAVAVHSHMADLPRILILFLSDFFFSMEMLRYLYIFLNLILGPIGMYLFLKQIIVKHTVPAFLGALFYLLNLGTLQQFVVPFEMFITQYGFLPWLFLFATQRRLLLFSLVSVLAAPMAYAATLWYIYFVALMLYLLVLYLPDILRKDFSTAKKGLIILILTIFTNAFWLLPNAYFVSTHGSEISQANINKLFSEQAFLYNKEFGNIQDIGLMRSFLFDWNIYTGKDGFGSLLSVWINHLANPAIKTIGVLLATVAGLGLIYGLRSKHNSVLCLLPVLLLCLLFLFNDNFPISQIYTFLAQHIPLFQEALRFPHDKVLVLFTFTMAAYFALGQQALLKAFSKLPSLFLHKTEVFQGLVFSILLVFYMLPAFQGNLISPYMRISIPQEYFQMFDWFNQQEGTGKVANLPIHSFWGWEYYDWYDGGRPSFQGAGFLWFGIKQPLLSRDFDRWRTYNEQYYREMAYTIYTQNSQLLQAILKKYDIGYVLLDTSVIAPESDPQVLSFDQTKQFLEQQPFFKKRAQFGTHLFVYETTSASKEVYLLENASSIKPKTQVLYEDFAYETYGDYITTDSDNSSISYPLRSIVDNQSRLLPNIAILTQEGVIMNISKATTDRILNAPSYLDTEDSIPASLIVQRNANLLTVSLYPRVFFNAQSSSTLPIQMHAILPQNEEAILTVNQKDAFFLRNIQNDTPLAIGTVFFNTKEDNVIGLYATPPDKVIISDFSTAKFDVTPCNRAQPGKFFGVNVDNQGNGFSLFGKDVAVCMVVPLAQLLGSENIENDELLTTMFTYEGGYQSYLCLIKLVNGACLQSSRSPSYFAIKKDDFKSLGIKVLLDATQSEHEEKVVYKDIAFGLTKAFFLASFSKDTLLESLQTVSSDSNTTNAINLPFSGNKKLSQNITQLPRTSGECINNLRPGSPKVKKEIVKIKQNNYIHYASEEGSACDSFSYQNLSGSQGYLVAITSRNVKGLPLTMCITNHTSKRCDIYVSLSKSQNFTQDIFLLPPTKGDGFDININNLGIKKTPAVNDLEKIIVIPFPYKWLSQITIGKRQIDQSSRPMLPLSVTQGNSDSSVVKMSSMTQLPSTLVFSRSFELGWKAYAIAKSQGQRANWIELTLPFLFGKEITEHVLVNNWANGWLIQQTTNNKQQTTIVIVYLPQYLEYIGFGIMMITITSLVVGTFRIRSA